MVIYECRECGYKSEVRGKCPKCMELLPEIDPSVFDEMVCVICKGEALEYDDEGHYCSNPKME